MKLVGTLQFTLKYFFMLFNIIILTQVIQHANNSLHGVRKTIISHFGIWLNKQRFLQHIYKLFA